MTLHCALGMVAKQTNAYKCMVVYCPHVSGMGPSSGKCVTKGGYIEILQLLVN